MNLHLSLLALMCVGLVVGHTTVRDRLERQSRIKKTRPEMLIKISEELGEKNFAERLENRRSALERLANRRRNKFAAGRFNRKGFEESLAQARRLLTNDTIASEHNIADLNTGASEYLFEGDIMLTTGQIDALDKAEQPRTKRGAPLTFVKKWPKDKPVPFSFYDYNEYSKQIVRGAIKEISDRTCINFEETDIDPKRIIIYNGNGCSAQLGMQEGTSFMSIQSDFGGCTIPGIVQHEFMHALGIAHTQTRFDRDDYVTVNSAAVDPKKLAANFAKYTPEQNDNLGMAYDYGSVMHYGARDFSVDENTPSIIPKDLGYLYSMGQRKWLTFNDVRMINTMYQCSESCCKSIQCQNGGYQNPSNCTRCLCNDFFDGDYCEKRKHGYFRFNETEGNHNHHFSRTYTFEMLPRDFPELLYLNMYDLSKHDVQQTVVEAPPGYKMRLRLTIDIGPQCHEDCAFGGLSIVDNKEGDLGRQGKMFCCAVHNNTEIVTESNVVGVTASFPTGMNQRFIVSYDIIKK